MPTSGYSAPDDINKLREAIIPHPVPPQPWAIFPDQQRLIELDLTVGILTKAGINGMDALRLLRGCNWSMDQVVDLLSLCDSDIDRALEIADETR